MSASSDFWHGIQSFQTVGEGDHASDGASIVFFIPAAVWTYSSLLPTALRECGILQHLLCQAVEEQRAVA